MKIEYFKDPVWANAEHTAINMTVKFEEHDVELPFTASPADCETHGVELFNRAVTEEVGAIKDFVKPVITVEQLAANARSKRNMLLSRSDWTQLADKEQSLKDKWAPYRKALADLPLQDGFPQNINWPVAPV